MSITGKMMELIKANNDDLVKRIRSSEDVVINDNGPRGSSSDASTLSFNNLATRIFKMLGWTEKQIKDRLAESDDELTGKNRVSLTGPMDCIYKIREAQSEIMDSTFTLPALSATANAAAGGPLNTWTVADVATVTNNYNKMLEVLKKLKPAMASIH